MRRSGQPRADGAVPGVRGLQPARGEVLDRAQRGPAHRVRGGREERGDAVGVCGAVGVRGVGEWERVEGVRRRSAAGERGVLQGGDQDDREAAEAVQEQGD